MQQRLFEITLLLTERGGASAGELAQRMGVSRRTIYRDIDALSSAGIPVYAERGKGGGIRLLPGYVMDKTLFTQEEQQQIIAHFGSLQALGTPDTQAVLDKLGALFGRSEAWLEVDFAPWAMGQEARDMFRTLRDAILRRQLLRFTYVSAEGQPGQRTVEPVRLLFRGQGWYLHAYCRSREGYRFFKLTRISGLEVLEEQFTRVFTPEETATEIPRTQTVELELRFASSMAFRVFDEFKGQDIQRQEDGSFLVKALFPAGDWLLGHLLSYGPGLTVLKPEKIRKEITENIKKMLDKYTE